MLGHDAKAEHVEEVPSSVCGTFSRFRDFAGSSSSTDRKQAVEPLRDDVRSKQQLRHLIIEGIMSIFRALAPWPRTLSPLASGLALAACYHVPSTAARSRPSDERVSVGYGMQPAAHAGGSVQSAVAEDFKNETSGRAEELFSGRFSGVRVLRTVGGGLQVSIRGGGLWSADQQPLYVVDGVAVTVE